MHNQITYANLSHCELLVHVPTQPTSSSTHCLKHCLTSAHTLTLSGRCAAYMCPHFNEHLVRRCRIGVPLCIVACNLSIFNVDFEDYWIPSGGRAFDMEW